MNAAVGVAVAAVAMAIVSPAIAVPTASGEWCGRHGAALPLVVQQSTPGLALRGEGQLRWFGLLAYRARLWSPGGRATSALNGPLALEIQYARHFRGEQLAARSVDEMRHTGAGSDDQRRTWGEAMANTFRDVDAGDCILGVTLASGATQFFRNGAPLGANADGGVSPWHLSRGAL